MSMDTRSEIREFLTSRRARITPEDAGLNAYGARRVPGLRREEVAVLAGVSAPYYTRLERGDMSGVSDSVLDALSEALRLDDAERSHLFDLARAVSPTTPARRRRAPRHTIRPAIQQILDGMTHAAAFVRNDRLDILGGNELGRALYAPMFETTTRPVNTARFLFLDPKSREFYLDWERAARDTVAVLRSAAGRDPHDRALSDLVGELSTQSDVFRTNWASHNVRFHINGVKHFRHPDIGEITLNFERLDIEADRGLTIFTYTADPGSRNEESLRLLGSWTAPQPRAAARGD